MGRPRAAASLILVVERALDRPMDSREMALKTGLDRKRASYCLSQLRALGRVRMIGTRASGGGPLNIYAPRDWREAGKVVRLLERRES